MKYKGIELKEVTEPQIFIPPKKMLVWDKDNEYPSTANVYAIVGRKDFPVICGNSTWRHCAGIPEVTESKPVTYRELARWLANGNGEVKSANTVCANWNYYAESENKSIPSYFSVRKWEDTEWHKPTREYLELEDK